MNLIIKYLIVFFAVLHCTYFFSENPLKKNSTPQITFKENKGQVSDQFYKARTDILFSGTDGKLVFHLKNNGISYQLSRVDKWKDRDTFPIILAKKSGQEKIPEQITTYRLDVDWINANTHATIIKGEAVEGYDNYYLESCPNGALEVKSFKQITYQQLYKGIDLMWHEKNGNLKYDYIVAAGADYKQIQLKINGAQNISINKNGELIIITPLGELIEQAPVVKQNGMQLKAKWVIKNNIISFDIENVNSALPFIIDPLVRLWGTFYGGSAYDEAGSCFTDLSGNVFFCGGSVSNNVLVIATIGAHQTTFGGGISDGDAFLVKFDQAGIRLWGTYYGGAREDYANSCWVNSSGDVYITGGTSSTNPSVIATAGCHQPNSGGGTNPFYFDAFLAKFNSSGFRQWGTYFGGNSIDRGYAVTGDNLGDVYITGYTNSDSADVIATIGSYQSVIGGNGDGFLAKFNSSGVRLWSTYYGGDNPDQTTGCITDMSGNIYIGGGTNSTISIASPGSYQPTYGGGALGGNLYFGDAFLAKFNSAGVRQWGTYYGGTGQEIVVTCMKDAAGDIYFAGATSSNSGTIIATLGTHQPLYGGGTSDAMFVKFNSAGLRQWGTYYGGTGSENFSGCVSDDLNGYIYFSGITNSSTGTVIATSCTYQDIYGGGSSDAFLTKFTLNGSRIWGTYYGGTGADEWSRCGIDATGNVFLCGETSSTGTVIASPNGHQLNNGGGSRDAFIVKFDGCKSPPNTTTPSNQLICLGRTTTLSSISGCGINWYNEIGGTIIGTGSAIAVSPVTTTTFYIDNISCGVNNSLTPVTVTVLPSPTVSINASNTLICSGNSVNINSAGAANYTWLPGGSNSATIIINPNISITQTVIGSNGNCSDTVAVLISVIQYPNLIANYFPNPSCSGSAVSFSALGAQSYTWSPANSLVTTSGTLVLSVPLSQNTTFTLNAENSSGTVSCLSQQNFSVNVIASFTSQISNSVTICRGNKTGLNASGGNTYNWLLPLTLDNPNQPTVLANPLTSTIYSVAISINNLCPITKTVLVNVVPTPYVNAGRDTSINLGDQISLIAHGNGIFKWISGEGLSCFDCSLTTVSPLTRSCYVVELTDQTGCKAQDEVCVEIIDDFGVYIPNTFTPNNDGMNDVFQIFFYGVKTIYLIIYDRWGNKLFTTDDPTKSWDGTFLGKPCQVDTYIFKLDYLPNKGSSMKKIGNVNLIR